MARAEFSIEDSGVVLERRIERKRPSAASVSAAAVGERAGERSRGGKPPPGPGERGQRRTRGALAAALPWLLLFVVLGGGSAAALWGYQQYALAIEHAARLDEEAGALGAKVARLEAEALALGAELGRARGGVAAALLTSAAATVAAAEPVASPDASAAAGIDAAARAVAAVITPARGKVIRQPDRLIVELADPLLFPRGAAELTDGGRVVLLALGDALNQIPDQRVWVQGHPDAVPIQPAAGALLASGWELSAARALAVVHYLQDDALVAPDRLAAVAFGPRRPRSRERSRAGRIEIVLAPSQVVLAR